MRIVTLILIALCSIPVLAKEQAMVISTQRLSMDSALKIAQGAIEACRKKGIQIAVTVVDRNGQSQVMLRDVLAPVLAAEVSMKKAYTAASFMAATSALTRQAQGPLAFMDNMMFGVGGLPIQAAGHMYGAVGVSGASEGKDDEECAQAGMNKIIDDLEML